MVPFTSPPRVPTAMSKASAIVIDLEFDTNEHVHAFRQLLETKVWAVPVNSPALIGSPEAQILERVVTA